VTVSTATAAGISSWKEFINKVLSVYAAQYFGIILHTVFTYSDGRKKNSKNNN